MTVEEFYKYCKERGYENMLIYVSDISAAGCFVGFKELKPEMVWYDDEADHSLWEDGRNGRIIL